MATDPSRYQWGNFNPENLRKYMSLLQQGGVASQVFPTGVGGFRGQADQAGALPEGYDIGQYDMNPGMPGGYDGGEYMVALRDGGGNIVGEDKYQRGTLNGLDKAIQGMVFSGVGAGFAGGLLGMGAGMAGGATAGAVGGGLNAAADGGNVLKGALVGGALGGAGGWLNQNMGSLFPGGDAAGGVGVEAGAGSAPVSFDPMPQFNISPGEFGTPLDGLFNPYGAPDFSMSQFATSGIPSSQGAQQGGGQPPAQEPGQFDPSPESLTDPNAQTVDLPSRLQFDPMPQFNAPPGNFGDPLDLVNPYGTFNPSMAPFLPPTSTPGSAPAQQPAAEPAPAQPDTSFRPSQNYGDGMTGNQTGAYDAVIGATGSAGLANTAATVAGGVGGLVSGLGGLGTILPVLGAVAGSQPSGGGTQTRESRMDPRMDPYVFDSFMPEWKKRFDASNGGVNDTMKAGWNQQLGLLNDPAIASQLSGMRGGGLLQSQGPVAGNPFSDGRMSLGGGQQGLLGGWNQQPPQQPQGPQAGGPGGLQGGGPTLMDGGWVPPGARMADGSPIPKSNTGIQPQQPPTDFSRFGDALKPDGTRMYSGATQLTPQQLENMTLATGGQTYGPPQVPRGWRG